MGEIADWDVAEAQLREALDRFGEPWTINEGDGAFYGPKIDVSVADALGRSHQCATVQLDFNLPARFGLQYRTADGGSAQPIMIHRAVLGSVERFMAILAEHTGGAWPVWCSPRQVFVAATADGAPSARAAEIVAALRAAGVHAEMARGGSLGKQIREAKKLQFNYVGVVGPAEVEAGNVAINERGVDGAPVAMTVDEIVSAVRE